ncbi:alpha/beta hydrolase [Actinobacteria bacterium YIM 96077]|uniref:Alpha/beta hydrolase n=1 Tax=Phytoactinopolyspora halophila TaxID=1981511 RepID=A0A329QL84_9ACTN|nr:alpha/beta hydrolase [Phytoactinopolyspora halophila]AYY15729.1 alpha/beta hydrolase [Actinobacteria bacterium YIM 96077]RAW13155.1 alpha/beta hydrolase [Phytoactinopolyspora halophila]
MSHDTTVPAHARTLDVPGARLYHEVRGAGPLVVLVGAPMDATSFEPLAELLAVDHTVLTTDPRGINRSPVDDPEQDSTPEMRADDLARLVEHLDAGPAALLGSSGGAVSALALAQSRPDLAHTVIAHEPPLIELLPDRAERHAGNDEVIARWIAGDHVGSWRAFLDNANIVLPEDVFQAMFAQEPDPQTRADTDFQNRHMLRPTTYWRPDMSTLRSVRSRIVVGIGEESAGEICDRTSTALASALGVEPAMFPGGHLGFADDPAAFAARLRAVLYEV